MNLKKYSTDSIEFKTRSFPLLYVNWSGIRINSTAGKYLGFDSEAKICFYQDQDSKNWYIQQSPEGFVFSKSGKDGLLYLHHDLPILIRNSIVSEFRISRLIFRVAEKITIDDKTFYPLLLEKIIH